MSSDPVPIPARTAPVRTVLAMRDPWRAEQIQSWLARSRELAVVAECLSAVEITSVLARHRPDLLMIDSRLVTEGSLREFRACRLLPQVCFVARDNAERAALVEFGSSLTAWALIADRPDQFLTAVEGLAARIRVMEERNSSRRLVRLLARGRGKRRNRIIFLSGSGLVVFDEEEIDWVESRGSGAVVHCERGTFTVAHTFSQIARRLTKRRFLVTNSIIINLEQVRECRIEPGKRHVVILQSGTSLSLDSHDVRLLLTKLNHSEGAELRSSLDASGHLGQR